MPKDKDREKEKEGERKRNKLTKVCEPFVVPTES